MVSGVVNHHVSMRRLAEVGRSVEARLHRRLQVDGWVERARQLGKSCGAGARADVEQRAQQALDEALARADAADLPPLPLTQHVDTLHQATHQCLGSCDTLQRGRLA